MQSGTGAVGGIAASMALAAIPGVGPILASMAVAGGLIAEGINAMENAEQEETLAELSDNMVKYNGNFEKAYSELSPGEQALLDRLGMTDSELSALAQEMANNTNAVLENNKILLG
jgi:hypothetical protein